jgi:hypothetical protein
MKKHVPFLLHQIARFGVLTVPQMKYLCMHRCKQSSLYASLRELLRSKHVTRVSHPMGTQIGYSATMQTYAELYGPDHHRASGARIADLSHAISCAEAMIQLCRYAHVTGIATEYEISSPDLSNFSLKSVPDGIVQISSGEHSFEIAVEVESTRKTESRIDNLIKAYTQTFSRKMICKALLIVATDPVIFGVYQKKIPELPQDIEKKILLMNADALDKLSSERFGSHLSEPGMCLEKQRSHYTDHVQYFPIKSIFKALERPLKAPPMNGQSQILQ